MVNLKTEEELVIIRESAQILGKAHGEIAKLIRPGVKTITLDKVAEQGKWLVRFPMWDWVGGRTSELSAVGLLPAALQGINIVELLRGAGVSSFGPRLQAARVTSTPRTNAERDTTGKIARFASHAV